MEEKYFIKKSDESGCLLKLLFGRTNNKSQSTYIIISDNNLGFYKMLYDYEVEPAPTHLVVAERLKGNLDKKLMWNDDIIKQTQALSLSGKQFQMQQEWNNWQFNQKLQIDEIEFNKISSQIQKGIVQNDKRKKV